MVNIIVCIKHVPDTETRIKIKEDKKGIETTGIKYIISPYDEFALEEAIRIKEKHGGTVTTITMGPKRADDILRTALAVGADNAIHILSENGDSINTVMTIGEVIKTLPYDIILTGKEAVDYGMGVFPSGIAEYLGINNINNVTKLDISNRSLVASRQVEGGDEIVEASFPVVISAQKGLNTPRYPALPNIFKAKKREVKILDAKSISVPPFISGGSLVELSLPPPKKGAKMVEGQTPEEIAAKLIKMLKEEAKVL